MRRILILLALLLWAVPASADVALVTGQVVSAGPTDDVVVTLPSAAGVGNHVYILASIASETNTLSITDTPGMTWKTLVGPLDSPGGLMRQYVFCAAGDGSDASWVVTSSTTASVSAYAAEFSGATCPDVVVDSDSADTSLQAHDLSSTNLAVVVASSLLLSVIQSSGGADFAAGTNMTQISDDTSNGAAIYRITTATGNYSTPYTSAANETSFMTSIVVSGAVVAASGPPLGGLGMSGAGR